MLKNADNPLSLQQVVGVTSKITAHHRECNNHDKAGSIARIAKMRQRRTKGANISGKHGH